ncbi:predicted protein [Sclerotinia sclerotiorum 1980 UF-70]|uniref:Uncharacterized protein n=1 Tax=Sclerotinia sclerotiorum (strain ATCC 18683 / 1980 / Ss-1) TaxID=665079 RepID=A7F4R6_SCLS1|nr:predicted protein [Sclerotinia sclerotiorum 1980 UF-70]EDN97737.1 predicted protein [Sclerotinia sclerotiorum 1980 UF-70]
MFCGGYPYISTSYPIPVTIHSITESEFLESLCTGPSKNHHSRYIPKVRLMIWWWISAVKPYSGLDSEEVSRLFTWDILSTTLLPHNPEKKNKATRNHQVINNPGKKR